MIVSLYQGHPIFWVAFLIQKEGDTIQPPKQKPILKDIKVKQTIVNTKELATNRNEKTSDEYAINKSGYLTKSTVERSIHQAKTISSKKRAIPSQAIHTGKKQQPKSSKVILKKSKKLPKTSKNIIKKASNTVQSSKRYIQRTKQAAKSTTKTAKLAAKIVKAIAVTIKRTVDSLITAIAAGGWVVVIIIIVVVAIIYLVLASPFGILFNEESENTPSIQQVIVDINSEFNNELKNIINNYPHMDKIVINTDNDSMYYTPPNWVDILAIFAVKNTTASSDEYLDVLIMEDKQVTSLKKIFWDMNTISYKAEEIENEDGIIESVLSIDITSLSYAQGANLYRFNEEQRELLSELLSVDYYPIFMELCGMDSFIGLTPEEATALINSLPNSIGGDIVRNAISRLGHPYSQSLRGQGNYLDCSYLSRWCYNQTGISDFTAGTAANQAKYCVDNNMTVDINHLQVGDLIFWSFSENGRYENITHVGIYAGNGYVIDASASRGMVVYRKLFGQSAIVVCGRPR